MVAEELIASINMLIEQMDHEPDDLHEIHLKLIELLSQLRSTGMPLPEDLVELEHRLAAEIEGVESEDESDQG